MTYERGLMKNSVLFVAATLLLSGCQTYHMTSRSLIEQLADVQTERK